MGWVEWISANILKTGRVYWRAPVLLIIQKFKSEESNFGSWRPIISDVAASCKQFHLCFRGVFLTHVMYAYKKLDFCSQQVETADMVYIARLVHNCSRGSPSYQILTRSADNIASVSSQRMILKKRGGPQDLWVPFSEPNTLLYHLWQTFRQCCYGIQEFPNIKSHRMISDLTRRGMKTQFSTESNTNRKWTTNLYLF